MIEIRSYDYRHHVLVVLPRAVLIYEPAVIAGEPGELLHQAASLGEAMAWVDGRCRTLGAAA